MTNELDTLATALYVRIDDMLKACPDLAPSRPAVGIAPKISDAELITLAVLSALLGYVKERRWLRHVRVHLLEMFPYVPGQSGYNKRLRKLATVTTTMIRILAVDTSLWSDDVWVIDSTPVECGRSRETAHRSDLAGWAQYGYCASHSRYFWGLRLHLVCTLGGLPILFGLTGAKADERETLLAIFGHAPEVMATHPHQILIGDKNYYGATFEADLAAGGVDLLRPTRKGETPGAASSSSNHYAKPSSRSTRRSRANSTSNVTAGAPLKASGSGYSPKSSPSQRSSGTTTTSAHPSNDH